MEKSIFVIHEEIKKIENNIDYLQKKNSDHQSLINGNNERIEELNEVMREFKKAILILSQID